MSTVDPERLALAMSVPLDAGGHGGEETPGSWCVMEAVAYVAGEPWSDAPQCACPVITRMLVRWNDALPDEDRTRLLRPLIPEIVGTRGGPALEERRRWRLLDWMVHVYTPAWLDLAGLTAEAEALRGLPAITGRYVAEAPSVLTVITAARDAARAAESAARAAASIAAMSAPMSAARSAAWNAAWTAAASAAASAAWDAAVSAARSAARSALAPTVRTLQASAVELVRELCAMTEAA